jgi:5'-deoxynucleotidase YfbR-like HD superfamily hydrolase
MNKPVTHFMDPRHAGRIKRYHTYPHLGEQEVGEHSWNDARILLAIWPDAPRHLIIHCIIHDIGEIGSGDVPMYAKRNSPDLKRNIDAIERNTYLNMALPWYLPPAQELTPFERAIFKLVESIEIFEWAWHQYNMGNKYAEHAISVHRGLIKERAREIEAMENVPEDVNVTTMLLRVSNYYERRDRVETDINGRGTQ